MKTKKILIEVALEVKEDVDSEDLFCCCDYEFKDYDENMLYAFYSVGYKPGGANPPVSEAFQGNISFDFDQALKAVKKIL